MLKDKQSQEQYYKKLTRNMVLLVVTVSFIPMLLISGGVLRAYRLSYNEKLYAHLKEVVHRHAQDIDSFLNARLNNLQFLLDSCTDENLFNEAVLQEKLFQLQQKYDGVFEDLGVIDERGVQKAYAGRYKLGNVDYSDAPWFNEALEKTYYISDIFLGIRSKPHFIISVKRFRQDRYHLLRATINFETFNYLAENLRFGKTGFAFILNKKGEFQTKPHNEMLPSNRSYKDFISAGTKAKHGIYTGELNDEYGKPTSIYLAAPLKDDDWILVYTQEKGEAFADLIRTQFRTGITIFIGGLLIVLMNAILFHKVINHLTEVDRQREIMSQQIIDAGKLASVGRLAAGTAHEINNPVAIMVQEAGWIEDLLAEEELKAAGNLEEIKRALKQINIQGNRCKEITHQLLNFARRTDSQKQSLQLNELINEVVALSDKKSYTGISINTDLDRALPDIYGSPSEIQQIMLNLINNARYALEKNGGQIDITTRLEEKHVLAVVEDNGPGIPEANLDRIFDPFFTTKPVGQGTGLGLSICFGIIKRMGGDITVHSNVDEGTRFEIRIPLESSPSDTA